MALPKIKQPIFELAIPSNGQIVRYRPFTVAEEKILLVAKESSDTKDTINAYKGIINNCCLDPVDVDKLCSFDIEYLFINLRSKSVSNVIEAQITDETDGLKYKLDINLDTVQVSRPDVNNNIKLNDDVGVVLKYPTFDYLSSLSTIDDSSQVFSVVIGCIDQIYEGETVYEASNYTRTELEEFVMSFGMKELAKVKDFFEQMPKVYIDATYTRKDGTEAQTRVEGIQSFFV